MEHSCYNFYGSCVKTGSRFSNQHALFLAKQETAFVSQSQSRRLANRAVIKMGALFGFHTLSASTMKKTRSLTLQEHFRVSVMSEEGFSCRQIASKVGCSHSAVVKIVQKKKTTGSVVDKRRSGRIWCSFLYFYTVKKFLGPLGA